MINQFRKTLFCFFLLILIVSCKSKRSIHEIPESVSAYVYAYTSGEISKAAPIRVRFTNALINSEQIGTKVDENIIEFEPQIKGEAIWEDDRTIYFKPSQYLPAKEEYIGKISLKKLFNDVPQDARVFEFGFQVKEQNFYLRFNGLRAVDPENGKIQRLEGYVYTNDLAEDGEVEKLFKVNFPNQQLKTRWEHSSDKLRHDFYIEGIARNLDDSELLIEWNGKHMGVNNTGNKSFIVPGINNFQVMDARVVQGEDQHVQIFFSDPLLKSQSLDGLVTISDYTGQLRFTIDGNQLLVYTGDQLNGERTVTIEAGLKNASQVGTKNRIEWNLLFEEPKPALRLVGTGVILPESEGLIFPFEAINLNAVDVEVFKIYNNNILQYLQSSEIDEYYYQMEQVGRIILQKQVPLKDLSPNVNNDIWTRYALDIGQLIQQDPNSIYQIRLGFRPEYSSYSCIGDTQEESEDLQVYEDPFDEDGEMESIWDYGYYGYEGYYDGFTYEHRDNPCFPAYYNTDNFIRRNVLASNLGMVAKSGTDGEMLFFVTDLRTAKTLSGIKVDIYDYQQQIITSVTTDSEGKAQVNIKTKPFVAVANRGQEKGYLKLLDPNALSLSKFDVSGSSAQKGIKGFIYGERGVWRPGDSLYLNFVLEDKNGKLPKNHPITFELYNPSYQLQQKFTTSENVNNVYPLAIATSPDAPTGNWSANVHLGGATFNKTLKIETIKPNRLKINLDFGKEELNVADMPMNTKLQVNWLHGAPARNLKAKIEMQMKPANTTFKKFEDYEFDDPARMVTDNFKTIFDGAVNDNGEAMIKTDFSGNKNLPGKMKSDFRIRAFESGGGSSEDNFSVFYHPFDSYVGVSVPRNRYGSKRIDIEKGGPVYFVSVNTKGEVQKNRKLKVGLYRSEWRWWWESDDANISLFNTSSHYNALDTFNVTTDNAGAAKWNVKVGSWGRYLVRVCDEESGHCSGEYFYAGYPWWGEEDNSQQREAAAMLMFSSDKKKYSVGETVELRIPSSEGGRALITIESGSKVQSTQWLDTEAEETVFTFNTKPEMAPTVYAHVSLMQPHGQVQNDLPIRMYGVIPINVEDPNSRLKPAIKMADVLKPEEKVKIEIQEESGQPMAYTIAVVDDGLLDLTRFKTPNPWDVFYAREALGVKTWDVYDHVLGAFGGQLEKILSIGGDGDVEEKGKPKANRFKPVVMHLGPFYLKKGGKAVHEFVMPNYVGSVRTMVVASNNGAYGNAEKTTPVRKPLMVLTTLPRVIGPGERLKVPVNVFAMEDKVKNVSVKIEETTGLVKILGNSSKQVSFSRTGDQMIDFEIEIPERTGIAKFVVTATGAGEKATQEIEIDVRNPNPYITDIYAGVLQNSEKWTKEFSLPGIEGTNTITLEVANIPPINLGKRLYYLIQYPHGCVEQTISSAFPQLYVSEIMEVSEIQKKEITSNIKTAIEKLKRFQNSGGGFSYWPGENEDDSWSTTYAAHFLLEAKNLGYLVPEMMISRWVKHQQRKAKNWTESIDERGYYSSNNKLMQAYRLYALALAGEPEFGAMNRLRESKNLPPTATWRLAAAYALAGKPEVGNQMVANLTKVVDNYTELSYTYGSQLRDQAMILEALVLLKNKKGAAEMVVEVSNGLGSEYWYNTQAISYSLLAFGKFMKENQLSDQLKFAYQVNGGQVVDAGSQKSVMHINIPAKSLGTKSVSVINKNNGIIYARLIVNGQPVVGDQTEAANHLAINVVYKSVGGQTLNPDKIPQGTDFVAEVSVTNPGTKGHYYKEMALSQIFPSGWEITNTRMTDVVVFQNTNIPRYQDIRDDRVYSYFNISSGQKQTYRVQLNASYQGRYYLPSISCEAMYDHTISARKKGQWVEVIPADGTIASK